MNDNEKQLRIIQEISTKINQQIQESKKHSSIQNDNTIVAKNSIYETNQACLNSEKGNEDKMKQKNSIAADVCSNNPQNNIKTEQNKRIEGDNSPKDKSNQELAKNPHMNQIKSRHDENEAIAKINENIHKQNFQQSNEIDNTQRSQQAENIKINENIKNNIAHESLQSPNMNQPLKKVTNYGETNWENEDNSMENFQQKLQLAENTQNTKIATNRAIQSPNINQQKKLSNYDEINRKNEDNLMENFQQKLQQAENAKNMKIPMNQSMQNPNISQPKKLSNYEEINRKNEDNTMENLQQVSQQAENMENKSTHESLQNSKMEKKTKLSNGDEANSQNEATTTQNLHQNKIMEKFKNKNDDDLINNATTCDDMFKIMGIYDCNIKSKSSDVNDESKDAKRKIQSISKDQKSIPNQIPKKAKKKMRKVVEKAIAWVKNEGVSIVSINEELKRKLETIQEDDEEQSHINETSNEAKDAKILKKNNNNDYEDKATTAIYFNTMEDVNRKEIDESEIRNHEDYIPCLKFKGTDANHRIISIGSPDAKDGKFQLIIDLGCSLTSIIKQQRLRNEVTVDQTKVTTLTGISSNTQSTGAAFIQLNVGRKKVFTDFTVVDGNSFNLPNKVDGLLGANFLQNCIIDVPEKKLYYIDPPCKRIGERLQDKLVNNKLENSAIEKFIREVQNSRVESPKLAELLKSKTCKDYKYEEWMQQFPTQEDIIRNDELQFEQNKKIDEMIKTWKKHRFKANENAPAVYATMSKYERWRKIKNLVETGHIQDEDVKTKLLEILQKNSEVVRLDKEPIPATTALMARIPLKSQKEVKMKQYPLQPDKLDFAIKTVMEMLEMDIIEESNGLFISPITVAEGKKKRLCHDYRRLNTQIADVSYGLPNIFGILHSLGNYKFIIQLDIVSAFHAIPIHPDDRKYTGFQVGSKCYQFCRVPFGLKISSFIFQRAIDLILRDCLGRKEYEMDGKTSFTVTKCYIDDVIITGDAEHTVLMAFEKVIEAFKTYKLRINPQKCKFLVKNTLFLGYEIGQGKISINQNKVEDLLNLDRPRTKKQVKQFLATINFFRALIKDVSEIEIPLLALIRNDTKFKWTVQAENSYQKLLKAITSKPVIASIDEKESRPLIVMADAGKYALGACLLVMDEESNLRPVHYYAKLLKGAEVRYSIYLKEVLAITKAVTEGFRNFLLGRHFTVITDNSAVAKLISTRMEHLDEHLSRMILKLSQYSFRLIHINGDRNPIADLLSRFPARPEVKVVTRAQKQKEIESGRNEPIDTNEKQEACEESGIPDTDDAQHPEVQNDPEKDKEEFEQIMGDDIEKKIIESRTEMRNIIEQYHKQTHLGVGRTYQMIRMRFHHPNLRDLISKIISCCDNCQRNKFANIPQVPLKIVCGASRPLEVMHVDLTGPIQYRDTSKYILVLVDKATKFTWMTVINDKSSKTVCAALIEIFLKVGFGECLVMDNGGEFSGETTRKTMKAMGVDQKFVSIYSPSSNGQVERYNLQLKSLIRCLMQERNTTDWPKLVPYVNFIINTSPQATLANLTPFQLFFGRNPRLNLPGYSRQILETPIQYLNRVQSYMKRAVEIANNSKLKMKIKNKKSHDLKAKLRHFEVGGQVLMKKVNRSTLEEVFQGPYEIREIRSDHNVGIWRNNKLQFVHKDLLKKYTAEEAEEDEE